MNYVTLILNDQCDIEVYSETLKGHVPVSMWEPELKYFAAFYNTSDYYLLTRDDLITCAIEHIEQDETNKAIEYFYMNGFKTLKDAKNYLKMHFNGEIADARSNLKKINSFRAGQQ